MKPRTPKQVIAFGLSCALLSLSLPTPLNAKPQAYTLTYRFDRLHHLEQFIPCANGGAGEIVVADAILHVTEHVTVMSGNVPPQPGDRIAFTGLTRAEVLSAFGKTSGTLYTAPQGGGEQYHATYLAPDNGPWAYTYHRDVHLRGPQGQQIRWRILQHGTITPDLRVVLDSLTSTFACN